MKEIKQMIIEARSDVKDDPNKYYHLIEILHIMEKMVDLLIKKGE